MKKIISLFLLIVWQFSLNAQKTDSLEILSKKYDANNFVFTTGAFVSGVVSKVRFGNKQLGLGVDINLEDALGLSTTNFVFRGSAMYFFGKTHKHAFIASYFAFLRSSHKVLETELEFNDYVYPVGTEINSVFNFSIIKFAYDYSFFKDDRVNLGAGIGFYIMPIMFKISVNNQATNTIADFIAPLPYAGLRTDFKILPKLYLKQGLDVMYAKFDTSSGAILDINIRLEHNTWKHFGFGAGLDFFKIIVRSETIKGNFNFVGNVEMGYTGFLIFAKYYF
jgi:hypothetical protein